MICKITDALRNFAVSMEQEFPDYCRSNPVYAPLFHAATDYAKELTVALDSYFVNQDSDLLHRTLIGATMDFLQLYENWIDALKPPDLKHAASKVFHSFLLRYSKGAVKAWRIWRIDLRKPRN